MKKSIIALAVMATMAANADETTLYGSVRMAYTYNDGGAGASSSEFANAGSRFGIKGSEDLGNGLSAVYKYENRINGNLDTNKLYAGLSGEFGTVTFGKQALPVDDLGDYSDPFNALSPDGRSDYALTSSDNSMVYKTNSMNGLTFGVGVVADGAKTTQTGYTMDPVTGVVSPVTADDNKEHNHVDAVSVAAEYENNGFVAGLGYSKNNYTSDWNDDEVDVITLGLGYGNEQFEVGLLADHYRDDNDDSTWARLSALYNVTPMDAVYIGASSWFRDLDEADDAYQAAIGYQHKFSNRTRVWAEYNFSDAGLVDGDENNQLSLGLRTDF